MRQATPQSFKWLTIRMTGAEYGQLKELASQTLSPNLSDYGRRVLLQKPVSIRYHNESLDHFIVDMVQLRKDLNRISDKQSHINEQDKTQLFHLIETISNHINNVYQLCSHI